MSAFFARRLAHLALCLLVVVLSGEWSACVAQKGTVLPWPFPELNPRHYALPLAPVRYVLLTDSTFTVHHVQAHRAGEKVPPSLASRGTKDAVAASLEVFSVLVPGRQLRRLVPSAEWQAVFQPHDTLLIAFSVLPYTDGTIAWVPIQLDTVPAARRLTLAQVVRHGHAQVSAYRQAGTPGLPAQLMDETLVPVLRRQGRTWVPRPYVLTSYFQVRPQPSQAYSKYDMATINVRGRVFPMAQLLQDSIRRYGNPHMSVDVIPAGNVLQGRCGSGYEFWQSPNIAYSHAPRLHYGLGSFCYRPGIGLVSASYLEYFSGAGQIVPDRMFDVVAIDGKSAKQR